MCFRSLIKRCSRHFIRRSGGAAIRWLICAVALSGGCKRSPAEAGKGPDTEAKSAKDAPPDEVVFSPEAIEKYAIRSAPATKRIIVPTFTAAARVSFNSRAVVSASSRSTLSTI